MQQNRRKSCGRYHGILQRGAAALGSLGAVLIIACNQDVTPPSTAAPFKHPTAGASRTESPALSSIVLVLNDTDGSGTLAPGTSLPAYEHFTWVKAEASGGIVTWTLNYPALGLTSPQIIGQGSNTTLSWLDRYNNFNQVNFGTNPRYIAFDGVNSRVIAATRAALTPFSYSGWINGEYINCGPQAGPGGLCGTFSGDAGTITLTRLEADLKFVASGTDVEPNTRVTFTASADPTVVDGRAMPVEVDHWTWVPDPDSLGGDSTDVAGCGGNSCTRTMKASGTMHITAYVNGKLQTGRIHVNVSCGKVPDDSIANSSSIRKGMTRALERSGINGPTSGRIEHGGSIYYDNVNQWFFLTDVPTPQDDLCSHLPTSPPAVILGSSAIAWWHDHPYNPDTEEIPGGGVCRHARRGGPPFKGPSPGKDYPSDGYPAYVFDALNLYVTNPDGRTFRTYPRVVGSCHRY